MQPNQAIGSILNRPTLVLNRSWLPVHVTTVRRALCMVYRQIAQVVATDTLATYDFDRWIHHTDPGLAWIRTPRLLVPAPDVILLQSYNKIPSHEAPFTRRNLFQRDDFTCQYCGQRYGSDQLSIDHVRPRSKGGATSWENCVLACVACNARKADLSLKDSGLRLRRTPRRPRWTPYLNLRRGQIRDCWQRFAPDANRRRRVSS